MQCCPLPAALPSSPPSCCEAPTSAQDAIPAVKQDGGCNATCCMIVVAYAPPPPAFFPLQWRRGNQYEREVFDLKMDMRI